MTPTIVVLVILVLLVILFVARSVRAVPQHMVEIVERLGRYNRTLEPGLNLVLPGLDRTRRIDLREQRMTLPTQPVITADNLQVVVPVTVLYRVTDPVKATYEIENYVAGVEQLTTTVLRNLVGGTPLDDVLTSHGYLTTAIHGALGEAVSDWGIEVREVELGAIQRA